jgi:hypothetical protein
MKLFIFSALSLLLSVCSVKSQAMIKVTVEYMEQVTISSHKLHVVVVDTNPDGVERIVASGIVYTHAKRDVSGAIYNGDAFITDANSPNNLVATISSPKVYDVFKMETEKIINTHIIK